MKEWLLGKELLGSAYSQCSVNIEFVFSWTHWIDELGVFICLSLRCMWVNCWLEVDCGGRFEFPIEWNEPWKNIPRHCARSKESRLLGISGQRQLHDVIQKKLIFLDYQEAPISFPPTFKFEKKEKGKCLDYSNLEDVRRVYKTKGADQTIRIPSYVDRIMWHSLPGCKDLFQVAGYFRLKVLIVGIIRCVKMSCNRITVQSCVNSYWKKRIIRPLNGSERISADHFICVCLSSRWNQILWISLLLRFVVLFLVRMFYGTNDSSVLKSFFICRSRYYELDSCSTEILRWTVLKVRERWSMVNGWWITA